MTTWPHLANAGSLPSNCSGSDHRRATLTLSFGLGDQRTVELLPVAVRFLRFVPTTRMDRKIQGLEATLRLLGEVHALEEGLEAGVGAERVVDRLYRQPTQSTISFFVRPMQALESEIGIVHTDVCHRQRQRRNMGRLREILQPREQMLGVIGLASSAVAVAQQPDTEVTSRRRGLRLV